MTMINKFNPSILSGLGKLAGTKQLEKKLKDGVENPQEALDKAESALQQLNVGSSEILQFFKGLEKDPSKAGLKHLGAAVQQNHNIATEFTQTMSNAGNTGGGQMVGVGAPGAGDGGMDANSGYAETMNNLNTMQQGNSKAIQTIIDTYLYGQTPHKASPDEVTLHNDAAQKANDGDPTAIPPIPGANPQVDMIKEGDLYVSGIPGLLETIKLLGPKITGTMAINNMQNTVLGDYKQTLKTFSQ
jgi:hypothetical protein